MLRSQMKMILAATALFASTFCYSQTISVTDFGIKPDSGKDATPAIEAAIAAAQANHDRIIVFPKGRYEFWPDKAHTGHYFISNHDPVDTRAVAMPIEGIDNLTIDGQGSSFIFHGVIMPIDVVGSNGITLKNFSIDYATQHFLYTKVLSTTGNTTDVQVVDGSKYSIDDKGKLSILKEDWNQVATASLEIDAEKLTVARGAKDDFHFSQHATVKEVSPGVLHIIGMPTQPEVGHFLVLRGVDRPNPAIWASDATNLLVSNITVHAAEGMAFIAQKSRDVRLDGFNVALEQGSKRLLTTNADAVHFSNCAGTVTVENGLFENMLDDGLNVHGSALHIVKLTGPNSMLLEWGHFQTYGFDWAQPGDQIEFSAHRTLLPYGHARITAIERVDDHHMSVTIDEPLPPEMKVDDYTDNIDWRPSLVYRNNTVRRIRSRGILVSTTAGALVEGNTFDKTTMAGVLIPGEAVDWYESTPSRNVIIRHNTFNDVNLAKGYAIQIGPTIATPLPTDAYNHRNILVEDNQFNLVQQHVVQALSLDGLIFRNNKVAGSTDFAVKPNDDTPSFNLTHTRCVRIDKSSFITPLTPADVKGADATLVSVDTLKGTTSMKEWSAKCADSFKK